MPSPANSIFIPTISVCGNEVPLPAYWKIIEFYELGHSTESIVSEVLRYAGRSEASRVEDIVFHVIDNQVRIQNSSTNVKRWNLKPKRKPGRTSKHNGLGSEMECSELMSSRHGQKETGEAFVLLRDNQTSQAAAYLVTGTFESRLVKGSDLQEALKTHGYVRDEFKHARPPHFERDSR